MVSLLGPQQGVYTLVVRAPEGDSLSLISSISEVHNGSDINTLISRISSPQTAVVTITVTEAPYLESRESLNMQVLRGLEDLDGVAGDLSVFVRLAFALRERAAIDAGPLAIVSCDNLERNGALLEEIMGDIASQINPELSAWISENVSFVSTSVDRITPRTTEALIDEVAEERGYFDAAPVVTEPFSSWILSGKFPAGRPAWEDSGAQFVERIEPYERRKLWLLNGSHSLLAYLGLLLGHRTIAEAIDDPDCLSAVQSWWAEASCHLPNWADPEGYTVQLLSRFKNARIEHRLEQIANDGLSKLRQRIVPVAKKDLAAGASTGAAATIIAAWIVASKGRLGFKDALLESHEQSFMKIAVADAVALIDRDLGENAAFLSLVDSEVNRLEEVSRNANR